jgi:hypothetical protein
MSAREDLGSKVLAKERAPSRGTAVLSNGKHRLVPMITTEKNISAEHLSDNSPMSIQNPQGYNALCSKLKRCPDPERRLSSFRSVFAWLQHQIDPTAQKSVPGHRHRQRRHFLFGFGHQSWGNCSPKCTRRSRSPTCGIRSRSSISSASKPS